MNVDIFAAPWSDEAAQLLAPAMVHEPGVSVETLARLVKSGAGYLYEVRQGVELVAAYVLRLEPKETGHEGVIVAAGGNLPGVSLIRTVLPVVEDVNMAGCDWVRVHTARPGMMRELARQGYKVREVVMAKEMGNGRIIQ